MAQLPKSNTCDISRYSEAIQMGVMNFTSREQVYKYMMITGNCISDTYIDWIFVHIWLCFFLKNFPIFLFSKKNTNRAVFQTSMCQRILLLDGLLEESYTFGLKKKERASEFSHISLKINETSFKRHSINQSERERESIHKP